MWVVMKIFFYVLLIIISTESATYNNVKESCDESLNSLDDLPSSYNRKQYNLALEEALKMIEENNRNLTKLTGVVTRLIDYSPCRSKDTNATIILNTLEKEIRQNTTQEMDQMMKKNNFNIIYRTKRDANQTSMRSKPNCAKGLSIIGTGIGALGGSILGSRALARLIPRFGKIIGAFAGAVLGAVIGSQLAKFLSRGICRPKS